MSNDSEQPPDTSDSARDLNAEWQQRRGHFAEDANVARSAGVRAMWLAAGLCLVVLGVIGALLPIMPTTPFVVLAAACFSRSSPRFYNAVLSHRVFGPLVYRWRETGTISRRVKVVAIVVIVVTFSISLSLFIPGVAPKIALASVALAVSVWIASRPERPRSSS